MLNTRALVQVRVFAMRQSMSPTPPIVWDTKFSYLSSPKRVKRLHGPVWVR